jgi:hypothetical protein
MTKAEFALGEDAKRAITDIIQRYFWLADVGRADEIPALFAPEATLTLGPGAPRPGTVSGQEIVDMFKARAAQTEVTTRHVVSNLWIGAGENGSAAARCILTLYRSDIAECDSYPLMVADIDDCFVNLNGSWLLRSRKISPVFTKQAK